MSAIVLQRRSRFAKAARGWPSSPNVKPAQPIRVKLGKGIFFAALMTDQIDPPVSNIQSITATKTGSPFITTSDEGIVAETTAANYNYIFPKALNNKPSELTMLTRFKVVGTATAYAGIVVFSHSNDAAVSPYVKISLKYSFSPTEVFAQFGTTSIGSPYTYTANKWYTCVITTKSGESTFWLNGEKVGSIASGGGTYGTDPRIIIGEDYGGGRTPAHQTSFVIGFDRVLTEGEIIAYSKDPWGELTEPANQSPFLISVPAGGGTPTLSSPGVINALSDRATPQVTLTF